MPKFTHRTPISEILMPKSFLKFDADPVYVNKLSLNALLSILPGSNGMLEWAKKNKINIRKEDDLIALIEEYNKTRGRQKQ